MWTEITKNGKYKFCEQITLENGKKIKACVTYDKNTRSTQKAAQMELHEKLEKKKQENPTLNTLTLGQLVDMYMAECKVKYKVATIKNKGYVLSRFVKSFGENVNVTKLDHVALNTYCTSIPRSSLVVIKSLFNWAYMRGFIETKISDRLYTLIDNRKSRDKLYLEPEEVKEILSLFDVKVRNKRVYNRSMLRLLIEFLVLTGLRIGEALALEISDVIGYELSVTKTLNLNVNGSVGTPKSDAGNRVITINNRVKQIIKEAEFLKRTHNIDSNIIFCNSKNKHFHYCDLHKILLNETGIRGFHIFRHTHASLLASKGIQLETIQRRLGHESDEITKKVYVHVTEKQRQSENKIFRDLDIM